MHSFIALQGRQYGRVIKGLASEPEGPGPSRETTNFLTDSSGQAQ